MPPSTRDAGNPDALAAFPRAAGPTIAFVLFLAAASSVVRSFTHEFCHRAGNIFRSFSRIQGRDGTIVNCGGEGASLFTVSKEGGRDEYSGSVNSKGVPIVSPATDQETVVLVPGAEPPDSNGPGDDSVVHIVNWLKSMQSRNPPNANVDHGFSHSIVTIMAAQSYWSGKKLYWDPHTEEILDQPFVTPS